MRIAVLTPLLPDAEELPESGVAAYSTALLLSMKSDAEITVLAQKRAAMDSVGAARVLPVWTPTLALAEQIQRALSKTKPRLLHVQHEFNLYGGLMQGMTLTLMLIALRRRGLRVATTVHGVVAPSAVSREFLVRNGLPRAPRLVRAAFRRSYKLIAASSDLVIVHHEYFRDLLTETYAVQPAKVMVIRPGAPDGTAGAHLERATRPVRTILTLGFLTGYKLPEVVVDVAESRALPGARFVFCVGANPRIKVPSYRERYKLLESRVRALGPRAKWNGYVPETDLARTFDEADVIVLPYTECVSVSAVASLAQRSRVPVCYSRALRPLFGRTPLEFELNAEGLTAALGRVASSRADRTTAQFISWSDAAQATEAAWRSILLLA